MRIRATFLAPAVALLVSASPACVAEEPSSKPALPKMTRYEDPRLGVAFNRPTHWVLNDKEKTGENDIAFVEWPTNEKVRPEIRVSMQDMRGGTTVISTTVSPKRASTDRILEIDGTPARLSIRQIPGRSYELLIVQMAKGTRSYQLTMTFATAEHERYVALADAVCASFRLLPAR